MTGEDFAGKEFAEAALSEAFAWVSKVHLMLEECRPGYVNRALSSPQLAFLPGLGGDRAFAANGCSSGGFAPPRRPAPTRPDRQPPDCRRPPRPGRVSPPVAAAPAGPVGQRDRHRRPGCTGGVADPGTALHWLGLSTCQLNAADARALAGFQNTARLCELWIDANALGADGTAALANSPLLAACEVLCLAVNGLRDPGVAALAGSPLLGRLTTLDLSGNQIGDAGALALADSPTCRP